jgi:hypothetical protein
VDDFIGYLEPVKEKACAKMRYGVEKDQPVAVVIGKLLEKFRGGDKEDLFTKENEVNQQQIYKLQAVLKNIADAERENKGLLEAINKCRELAEKMTTLVNLDPRYAEERTLISDPMKPGHEKNTKAEITTGWNAHRVNEMGTWEEVAVLRDRPAHTIEIENTLEGKEEFEVVAMADGNKYVGSIKWGWEMEGPKPKLQYGGKIKKENNGEASNEFYKAAEAWNKMIIEDPMDKNKKYTPIQLPTKQ